MTSVAPSPGHSVFLVDDHPLVRDGLERLIGQEADMSVCGQAEESDSAYDAIRQTQPDVVVLDLSLRGESGLDLIKRLQALPQPPRVLVLSMHDEAFYAERALRAGALGYVMKRESSGKVIDAIRDVLKGQIFVSKAITDEVMGKFVGGPKVQATTLVDELSDRELEVFRCMGQGQETRSIAEALHISLKTVQTHCMHIKAKLRLQNATMLKREAVRWLESERSK